MGLQQQFTRMSKNSPTGTCSFKNRDCYPRADKLVTLAASVAVNVNNRPRVRLSVRLSVCRLRSIYSNRLIGASTHNAASARFGPIVRGPATRCWHCRVAGAVAGRRGDAGIQDAVVERSSFHHSPLLAVQGRLGLARAHSGPLHGHHHALRRRLPPQRRKPRPQGRSVINFSNIKCFKRSLLCCNLSRYTHF